MINGCCPRTCSFQGPRLRREAPPTWAKHHQSHLYGRRCHYEGHHLVSVCLPSSELRRALPVAGGCGLYSQAGELLAEVIIQGGQPPNPRRVVPEAEELEGYSTPVQVAVLELSDELPDRVVRATDAAPRGWGRVPYAVGHDVYARFPAFALLPEPGHEVLALLCLFGWEVLDDLGSQGEEAIFNEARIIALGELALDKGSKTASAAAVLLSLPV